MKQNKLDVCPTDAQSLVCPEDLMITGCQQSSVYPHQIVHFTFIYWGFGPLDGFVVCLCIQDEE